MKITKKKEVVTEEIDLEAGIYYFECHEGTCHKIVLTNDNEVGMEYFLESVESWNSPYGIRIRKDFIVDEEELPYKFSAFIREISGKKIEKEEFEQQKQEVINRLIT
jgi:hypothetical protein